MIARIAGLIRDNKERSIGFAAAASFAVVLVVGADLLTGTVPSGNGLYYEYFIYTVAIIVCCHFVFFLIARKIKSPHRKRLPKYLEYAYAVVISLGLAQVYFSSPQIVSYIKYVGGNENELVTKILKEAQSYVQKECKTNEDNFTPIYCFKVTMITMAVDPQDYIVKYILTDEEFLNHVVRIIGMGGPSAVVMMSPIRTYARQLQALIEYTSQPESKQLLGVLAWIALMLLPVGIALRLVKTSLELYGGLDEPIAAAAA